MLQDAEYLDENEKKAFIEIRRRVTRLFAVRQFILFGSKARGDALPGSDIDLLIVTAEKLTHHESHMITHEIFEVNLAFGTTFSFVEVDEETWNCELWKYVPLHANVTAEGIPL